MNQEDNRYYQVLPLGANRQNIEGVYAHAAKHGDILVVDEINTDSSEEFINKYFGNEHAALTKPGF